MVDLLKLRLLKKVIVSMVFDTVASNTGTKKGVCFRLNEHFKKAILYLSCRRHVYECHIKNISIIQRPTYGPDHPLFKMLHIDTS